MLNPNLLFLAPADPHWRYLYAFATALRLLHYHRPEHLAAWNAWAGGTSFTHLPAVGPLRSNQVVFRDGQNVIVFFEGTRTVDQVIREVTRARLEHDPLSLQDCHRFFLWCLNEEYEAIRAAVTVNGPAPNVMLVGHSLGGAMAHIMGKRIKREGIWNLLGVMTFGQPRTFASSGPLIDNFRYLRVIHQFDPIPGVPPRFLTTTALHNTWTIVQPGYDYGHSAKAWSLRSGRAPMFTDNHLYNEIYAQIPAWATDPTPWGDVVQQNHIMRVYTDLVRTAGGPIWPGPDFNVLHALNHQIDALDFQHGPGNPPLVGMPPPGAFAHPLVTMPNAPGMPIIPPSVAGVPFEQRSVRHQFFFFGGKDIMAKTFKSKDRRLLKAIAKVGEAIQTREARVGDPTKTRTLSNRILMYPPGGEDDMALALETVVAQAQALLLQEN